MGNSQVYQFFQTAPSATQHWVVRTLLEVGGPGGVFLVASLFNLAACINMATIPPNQLASDTASTTRCDGLTRNHLPTKRRALCLCAETATTVQLNRHFAAG